MMLLGVAIERAHHPVDASGVLADDLHPARAGEMAPRKFVAHCVKPGARGLPGPPAALELGVERILVARSGRRRDERACAGNNNRLFVHRLPTAASALKYWTTAPAMPSASTCW